MKAFEEKLIYGGESRLLIAERNEDTFPFEWHFHNAYELTLITKGEGQRFVGDSIEAYKEGDLILLPPGLPHTWLSSSNSSENAALYIQFDLDCLGKGSLLSSDFKELKRILNSKSGLSFLKDSKAEEIMFKCLTNKGVERVINFLTLLKLVSKLEKRELSTGEFSLDSDEESRDKMDRIMFHIQQNESTKVPEIATDLGMSESSFRRFIKKNTGRSFTEYVNLLKTSEACRILIESNLPVTEVAMSCGYQNLSHFNRKFKEIKGVTPRQYRKMFENG